MKIEDIPVGPELDDAVLLQVFESEPVRLQPGPNGIYRVPFSTELQYAWLVVEALRERGYEVTVSAIPHYEYGCRVGPPGSSNTPDVTFESSFNPAEAICRAALKSLALQGYGPAR
jgi:hypothetical protein